VTSGDRSANIFRGVSVADRPVLWAKRTHLIQLNGGSSHSVPGATSGALIGDRRGRSLAKDASWIEAGHASTPENLSAAHLAVVALSRVAAAKPRSRQPGRVATARLHRRRVSATAGRP